MQSKTDILENLLEDDTPKAIGSHCRFCAQQNKYEDLLDISGDNEVLQRYLNMLATLKIDYIDLNDSKLPRTTCGTCYKAFEAAYKFFEQVKQSQSELNRLFYNVNVKREPTEQTIVVKIEPIDDTHDVGYSKETRESPKAAQVAIHTKKRAPKRNATNRKQLTPQRTRKSVPAQTRRPVTRQSKKIEVSPDSSPVSSDNETKTDSDISLLSSSDSDTSSLKTTDFSPRYCGLSVFESGIQEDPKESDESWTSYQWACQHCNLEFDTMEDVREHSKGLHGICYAFDCVDCDEHFNTFNSFVEHVRQHRDDLRYYCQYCNLKCEGRSECVEHALSHWSGAHRICDLCGEVCADVAALLSHKKSYKQATLPRRDYRKRPKQVAPAFTYNGIPVFETSHARSWDEYEWTCLECGVRLSDAESVRRHARELHAKCFAMKCVDCLKVVRNYRMFVTHVTGHRPHLKHYCQYCNQYIDNISEMTDHINDHMNGPQKPCDGCGQIFENNTLLLQHMKQYDPPRRKGTLTTEDLTCDICLKLFKTMGRLRTHRRTHDDNRRRDHVCDSCGKGFYSAHVLGSHVKTHHEPKTEICQLCKKEFGTIQKLKAHVLTHSELKLFTCDECGKGFRTKVRLKSHVISHSDIKKFKCFVCEKEFKFKTNMKSHMNLHTGDRPYSCQHCDRTFTNWANCNKHMIRKHGVTLAKTKLTSQGRIEINKETGKAKKLASDRKAREWLTQVMKPRKRGKKTAK